MGALYVVITILYEDVHNKAYECPRRVVRARPVAMSQIIISLSSPALASTQIQLHTPHHTPPEARYLPSFEKARHCTDSEWP